MAIQNNPDTIRLRIFSWFDPVIIVILLFGVAVSIPALHSFKPQLVTVYRDNQILAEYPLDKNCVFEIDGKDGPMKIKISNHTVSIITSNCQHQICVRAGAISHAHEQIVCVPNHILISLKSDENKELDAVAR